MKQLSICTHWWDYISLSDMVCIVIRLFFFSLQKKKCFIEIGIWCHCDNCVLCICQLFHYVMHYCLHFFKKKFKQNALNFSYLIPMRLNVFSVLTVVLDEIKALIWLCSLLCIRVLEEHFFSWSNIYVRFFKGYDLERNELWATKEWVFQ